MTFKPGSSCTVPIGGATLDFGSIVLGGSGGSVLTSADDCFSFVPRSCAAAPAATFTLTVASHHRHILHVISGPVKLTSTYHGIKVSAGNTVALTPSGDHRAVSSWPAAVQKLVPAGQRPPGIRRLKLKGRKATFTVREPVH